MITAFNSLEWNGESVQVTLNDDDKLLFIQTQPLIGFDQSIKSLSRLDLSEKSNNFCLVIFGRNERELLRFFSKNKESIEALYQALQGLISNNNNHKKKAIGEINKNQQTEQVRRALEKVAGTGEIIRIKYSGGSSPGGLKEIVPLKFNSNGNIIVRYANEEKERTLFLHLIEILSST
jgi:hypothetical protein